jgi:hypothetical protein
VSCSKSSAACPDSGARRRIGRLLAGEDQVAVTELVPQISEFEGAPVTVHQ